MSKSPGKVVFLSDYELIYQIRVQRTLLTNLVPADWCPRGCVALHAVDRLVDAVEHDGVVDAVDGDDRRARRVPHYPPTAPDVVVVVVVGRVQLLVEVI